MDYLKRMDELNAERIKAGQSGDSKRFYFLCNELGMQPEDELRIIYEIGMIEAENIRPREGGLERKAKKGRNLKPLTQDQITFLREYESDRFSDEYLLRKHFLKFRIGQNQDLTNYDKHNIRLIAKNLYESYKEKEMTQTIKNTP